MKKNNELLIIIITTVTFGILGRLLVRTPYMVFGDLWGAFLYRQHYGGVIIQYYSMLHIK